MNRWISAPSKTLLSFFGWPRRKSASRKTFALHKRRLTIERLEPKRMMAGLYWNPGQTAGAALGGDGTWTNGGAEVWYNPATGQDVAWNNADGDVAHFTGTGNAIAVSGEVGAGGIAFDGAGNTISGGSLVVPAGGMAVSVASGATGTIATPVDGTGELTANGPGTALLTAQNTYSGGTEIGGGTLLVQNYSLPSGGEIDVAATATLHYDTTAGNIQQLPATFTGGGTLLVDGGNDLTLGGTGGNVIVGFSAGALIDVEAGTLVASSGYNGQWTTNAASLNVATGATFNAVEANVCVDALTGGGTFEAGLGTVTETIGVTGGSGSFSGTIQDNGLGSMILVKAGPGTETLTGSGGYSGPTEVQGGGLIVQSASVPDGGNLSLGNSLLFAQETSTDLYWDPAGNPSAVDISTGAGLGGAGTWTDGGAAVWFDPASGQDVAWDNAANATAHFLGTAGAITVSGQVSAAAMDFGSDGYSISGGAILLPATGTSIDIASGAVAIASNIVGVGELTELGGGTVTVSADNTFSGGTDIAGGTLLVQNYSLPAGGAIDVAGGATLHYDTTAGAIAQMPTTFTGAGTLLVDGGNSLTFGGTGGDVNVSFSAGAVIDVEASTLAASAYQNGQWAANSASLNVAADATFAAGDDNVIVDALTGAGIVIGGAGTTTATIGVAGGSGTFSGTLEDGAAGTLAIVKTGTGDETLTGDNTYSGGTSVVEGVLNTNVASGQGSSVQYVLGDLTPGGTYEIYATWTADSSLSADVPYEIFDGSTSLGTVLVDQQSAPSGATIDGVTYQSLGQFTASGTSLTVSVLSTTFGAAQIGSVIAQVRTGSQITPENTYQVRLLEGDGSEADVGEEVPLTVGVSNVDPSGEAYVQDINEGTIQAANWEQAVDALVSGEASFDSTTVNFPDDLGAVPGFMVGTVAELSNIPGNQLGTTVGLAADTKVIALESGNYGNNPDSGAPPEQSSPDYDDGYWIVVVTIV